MKKMLVLFSVILICLTGIAKDPGESWVITRNGKIDCKKVKLGYNKARIVQKNGQKDLVAFSMINSFSLNGRVYTKLRVYADNKPTKQMAFMELIKTWGELSLYKFGYRDLGSAFPYEITYRYFLYKGGKMYLALDDRTLKNTCLHFGISYDSL